jgi:hypothetical protein
MILGVVHHRLMTADDDSPVAAVLAEALRGLLDFVETRAPDATEDDDVRALEDAAHVLNKVPPEHAPRLVAVLGERHSREVGLIE